MSKWKCEICNSEFENFQAQGFDHKIYCPLCYFKELYRKTELERERLNNIINEIEEDIERERMEHWSPSPLYLTELLSKIKELKEGK